MSYFVVAGGAGFIGSHICKRLPEKSKKVIRIIRARKILGFEPKVMLDEGLDKTIEYFRGIVK